MIRFPIVFLTVVALQSCNDPTDGDAGKSALESPKEKEDPKNDRPEDTPERILEIIEVGTPRSTIEEEFGPPDRIEGKDVIYEKWDARIPIYATREGLNAVYIEYDADGKVAKWVTLYL